MLGCCFKRKHHQQKHKNAKNVPLNRSKKDTYPIALEFNKKAEQVLHCLKSAGKVHVRQLKRLAALPHQPMKAQQMNIDLEL